MFFVTWGGGVPAYNTYDEARKYTGTVEQFALYIAKSKDDTLDELELKLGSKAERAAGEIAEAVNYAGAEEAEASLAAAQRGEYVAFAGEEFALCFGENARKALAAMALGGDDEEFEDDEED